MENTSEYITLKRKYGKSTRIERRRGKYEVDWFFKNFIRLENEFLSEIESGTNEPYSSIYNRYLDRFRQEIEPLIDRFKIINVRKTIFTDKYKPRENESKTNHTTKEL